MEQGFTYPNQDDIYNHPFFEGASDVFPFVTAKLQRLGILHMEQGFAYTARQPCTNRPF